MACLERMMFFAVLNCLWMVADVARLFCKAALVMRRSSLGVVFFGRPDLLLSCTLCVARKLT